MDHSENAIHRLSRVFVNSLALIKVLEIETGSDQGYIEHLASAIEREILKNFEFYLSKAADKSSPSSKTLGLLSTALSSNKRQSLLRFDLKSFKSCIEGLFSKKISDKFWVLMSQIESSFNQIEKM